MAKHGAFFRMPAFLSGEMITRTLVLLCVNRQMGIREIDRCAGSASFPGVYMELRKLTRLGVIARAERGLIKPYFLNPKHPSYHGFRALGNAAKRRYGVPQNRLRHVSQGALRTCSMPREVPCTLFRCARMTRCLLFVHAAGHANLHELADMLGLASRDALRSVRALEKLGLVVRRTQTGSHEERPAAVNPDFFAYDALLMILRGLLQIHPDITERVRLMRKYRLDRRLKVNWDRPHIKGPRRHSRTAFPTS